MRSIDERIGGDQAAILAACNSMKASIRVAMPGIVQSFDRDAQTVTVQLSIREKINGTNGVIDAEIPMLVDVPIVMPRAGGYSLLMVPREGDECLCVFSDLCIDSWWQSGAFSIRQKTAGMTFQMALQSSESGLSRTKSAPFLQKESPYRRILGIRAFLLLMARLIFTAAYSSTALHWRASYGRHIYH